MSKKQFYPMTKGTLLSIIDYKALIEMYGSFLDGTVEEHNLIEKNYTTKSKVKKINRKPRNRGI